jgi:chaperonin GroEL
MNKEVTFEPHENILKGINKLADAVQLTLGPSGKNVIIGRRNKLPLITKDGVTVARHISWSDELENIGASLVKEVASIANTVAGDGTTTATVLARAIYREGLKYIEEGYNPIDLKREIDEVVEDIVNELEKNKKDVSSQEEAERVALVSTNNDHQIAPLIGRAVWNTGINGFVSVEDAKDGETSLRFVEGLQLERGLISKYFCNDMARARTVYTNPYFLVCNHPIDSLNQVLPAMKWAKENDASIVIMAEAYEDNVLAAIIANNVKAGVKVICLHTPGTGDYKPDYIHDLAKATGAFIFEPDYATLKDFTPDKLGKAGKIVSSIYETTITGLKDMKDHVAELKESIESSQDEFYKTKLKDRHARLTSGIAILSLASQSETEQSDKKLRVEDAINATRCALEDGILPGGGVPLYRAASKVPLSKAGDVVEKALKAPIMAILDNAGSKTSEILSGIEGQSYSWGYDARTTKACDLYEAGVIDPFKVTRSSLKHAASVAGMLLTSGCCIMKEEEDDSK